MNPMVATKLPPRSLSNMCARCETNWQVQFGRNSKCVLLAEEFAIEQHWPSKSRFNLYLKTTIHVWRAGL